MGRLLEVGAAIVALSTILLGGCSSRIRQNTDSGADRHQDAVVDLAADAVTSSDASAESDREPEQPSGPSLLGNSQPCTASNQCHTGFCADGVCCNAECGDPCLSCSIPGSLGVCRPSEVGSDPRNDCPDEGISSCGRDGTCDGAGACHKYPAGAVCQQASCVGSILTVASRCDGRGTCVGTGDHSCRPYACGAERKCLTVCVDDKDCFAGETCAAGSCGKKPVGAICTGADECFAGFCEQGVCCAGECRGTCWSCSLTGTAGVCSAVASGDDALGRCAETAATTCGTDGKCDGLGSCRLHPAGTFCAEATCAGSTFTAPRTCNGAGSCQLAPPSSCGLYRCAGSSCFTACSSAADCASPNQCVVGHCAPPCSAQFNFESGTDQGWMANQFAATAFGQPMSDGTHKFCGARAIKSSASFGADDVGELFAPLSTTVSFVGRTIIYRLYIEGPPLPAGAYARGMLMKGPQYFPGPENSALAIETWNSVAYPANVAADRIGLQLWLPTGVSWKGTVYVDEVAW